MDLKLATAAALLYLLRVAITTHGTVYGVSTLRSLVANMKRKPDQRYYFALHTADIALNQ